MAFIFRRFFNCFKPARHQHDFAGAAISILKYLVAIKVQASQCANDLFLVPLYGWASLARATGLEIITILTLHCSRLILASDSFSWEVQRRSETSANCTILQLSFSIQRYLRNTRGGVDNIILVIFKLRGFPS